MEKNDLKRADIKTLIQHDFIKMNIMGDSYYEFIKDIVNELNRWFFADNWFNIMQNENN